MRTKNIYPTQLVIKRNVIKKQPGGDQSPGGDRLTLKYVEDMAKAIRTRIMLYDEQNNVVGVANVFFEGFCHYCLYDGTDIGHAAMYRMNITLYEPETIGYNLHISDSVRTIYAQPRGNPVKGERNVVKSLSNPEIYEDGTGVTVDRYVVTPDKKEVAYNLSGVAFAPASFMKVIEIFDAGCGSSAGFVEAGTSNAHSWYRVLKQSVEVNFVIV